MSMDIESKNILILLIIFKFPKLANTYDLMKILEWKFDFFDPRELLKKLLENGLVSIEEDGQITKYSITPTGIEHVNNSINNFRVQIHNVFPKEMEFLSLLLKEDK